MTALESPWTKNQLYSIIQKKDEETFGDEVPFPVLEREAPPPQRLSVFV